MKLLIIFGLTLFTASAYRTVNSKLGITNGENAHCDDIPYQVGLSVDFEIDDELKWRWCGGSLIGNKWVLTTAHCTEMAISVSVYLGATTRLDPEIKFIVKAINIIDHPSYDTNNLKNDISLIRIPTIDYTTAIQPVKLPAIAGCYSTYVNETAIASGWGYISDSTYEPAKELQWARLRVISNAECALSLSSMANPSLICVSTKRGISTCKGDSGGPLVSESSEVQIGLTSFSATQRCTWGFPVAFTRITSYLDWIKNHTGIYYQLNYLHRPGVK